ncbi:MAG: hypothetical protein ACI9MR_003979 [Myxococcota bacterium]|jgi:hypothetical protein
MNTLARINLKGAALVRGLTRAGLAVCLMAAACASTPTTASKSADQGPVLLLGRADYELHFRDGDVVVVRPRALDGAEPGSQERVQTYEEFRRLYGADALPASMPTGGVTVNGWSGLDCMRPGNSCGARPDVPPAQSAVTVKLHFGPR